MIIIVQLHILKRFKALRKTWQSGSKFLEDELKAKCSKSPNDLSHGNGQKYSFDGRKLEGL